LANLENRIVNEEHQADDRISRLEARLERLQQRLAWMLGAWVLSLAAVFALGAAAQSKPVPAPDQEDVLRVRGLIVEDAAGRARILIGAPLPSTPERKRRDPATAMVFLGEDGADRMVVGFTPDPQISGKLVQRISPSVGLQINDPAGNERTGYGYLEMGRVVLGIDWKNREALTLSVDDRQGFTALMMQGSEGGYERCGLYVDNQTSVMKIAGVDGLERLILKTSANQPAEMLVVDPATRTFEDVMKALRTPAEP